MNSDDFPYKIFIKPKLSIPKEQENNKKVHGLDFTEIFNSVGRRSLSIDSISSNNSRNQNNNNDLDSSGNLNIPKYLSTPDISSSSCLILSDQLSDSKSKANLLIDRQFKKHISDYCTFYQDFNQTSENVLSHLVFIAMIFHLRISILKTMLLIFYKILIVLVLKL